MIRVAVTNQSTVVSDQEVRKVTAALRHQVSRDVSPVWNLPPVVVSFTTRPAPAAAWQLVYLDDSDQAGALGYHDLTPAGQPLGKIFAREDQRAGLQHSVTASHELLEMLGDPEINRWALDYRDGWMHAYELCDAVEADEDGYDIGGVRVSNFVLPAFFEPQAAGRGGQFDFRGQVTEPFQTRPGGYQSVIRLAASDTVSQVRASLGRVGAPGHEPQSRPGGGTRAERRWRRTAGEALRTSR